MSLLDFDAPPARYGVMGNPISHSRSPQIHRLFAQQTGQRLTYEAMLVDLGGLPQAIGNFHAHGGKGLNITVPFKEDALRAMDRLTARAERAQAVNTIQLSADGQLLGDNTDGVGLVTDLTQNLGLSLAGRRILVLGAGGAVRGVLAPLLEQLPSHLTIANRTSSKAEGLAMAMSGLGPISGCGLDQLAGNEFDLIINGTAASLGGELPTIPDGVLASGGYCYDMMYAANPTPFMLWGKQAGAAATFDGLGMLVEQAAESFLLWRAIKPNTQPVIDAIRVDLTQG